MREIKVGKKRETGATIKERGNEYFRIGIDLLPY